MFIPYRHPEHIRKRQMPVEELILLGETANLLFVPGVDDMERVALDLTKEFFGNWVGMIVVSDLLPDKCRAPRIGPQAAVDVALGAHELFPAFLLASYAC